MNQPQEGIARLYASEAYALASSMILFDNPPSPSGFPGLETASNKAGGDESSMNPR
jgi:hypothetical protein